MDQNQLTERPHLPSVSIRLGSSLALGNLAALLLTGLVSAASPTSAQTDAPAPGDLDTTFGAGGVVTTSIGPGGNSAYSVAIQPDGKIVAAGYAHNGSDDDFTVVRYTGSGALDTTFGTTGVVTTPIDAGTDLAHGVAVQPDGKIVAVGYAHSGADIDFALVRYTVSGTLDTTFGAGGVVTTPVGPNIDSARGVAIQPDGKVVAAGTAHSGKDNDFALVRYTGSGALDATFGAGGIVTTPIGTSHDRAFDVAIQPDGKIVAVGFASGGSDSDFALVRYTGSGTLDTAFGTTGIIITPIGTGSDLAYGLAIQEDGRIVVAGHADNGSDYDFALVRYTGSGALDTTFGATGVVITAIGPATDVAQGIAIQRDGRIVAAGYARTGSNYDFALVRYTGSGTLDTTFGRGGIVTTPIGTGSDLAYGLAIQEDGKIVAAGSAHSGSDYDFALVRYHAGHSIYLPLVLR